LTAVDEEPSNGGSTRTIAGSGGICYMRKKLR